MCFCKPYTHTAPTYDKNHLTVTDARGLQVCNPRAQKKKKKKCKVTLSAGGGDSGRRDPVLATEIRYESPEYRKATDGRDNDN